MNWKRFLICQSLLFITVFSGASWAFHQWSCYKFPDATIYWYNGATGDYYNIYQEESITDSNSWHNSSVMDLIQVGSPGTSDQVNSYNGYYGFNGWLGLAQIYPNGCTITWGETFLNQSYLDGGGYSRTNMSHVACQEVAHTFGLDHNRGESNTCMNDTILTAPYPNQHDLDQLAIIYGGGGGTPPVPAYLDVVSEACRGLHTLYWASSSGATYYEVYRSTSSTFSSQTLEYSGSALSKFVNVSTTTYFRVRACNASGCSGYRNGNQPARYLSGCF